MFTVQSHQSQALQYNNITVSKNRTRMPRIVTDLFIFLPFRISSVTALQLQYYSF